MEHSTRLLMPPAALVQLKDSIPPDGGEPLLLRITNAMWQGRESVVGCASFSAPNGVVLVPSHVMEEVRICDGDAAQLVPTTLSKVTRLKLQPLHADFLRLQNPKVVLETAITQRYPTLSGVRLPLFNALV
jgi:Ubiquitin fusion degradation protein UFD1